MDSLGLFDPDLRLECLFDLTFVIEGWLDHEMILVGTAPVPPVPPVPPAPVRGERLTLGALTEARGRLSLGAVSPVVHSLLINSVTELRTKTPVIQKPPLSLGPIRPKPRT